MYTENSPQAVLAVRQESWLSAYREWGARYRHLRRRNGCFVWNYTYVYVMWNGSLGKPLVSGRVDGTGEGTIYWWEWCALALWEPKVWDIVWAMDREREHPADMAPMLLWVAQEINGGKK